jgi:PilZ domain
MNSPDEPINEDTACHRWDGRAPMDVPARLMLTSGIHACLLEDISLGGARISLDYSPVKGAEAFLQFGSYEVFCTITWSRRGQCGIKFDQRLPKPVLLRMREYADNREVIETAQSRSAAKGWSTGQAA